jgi:hypothetical protein
MNNWSISFGGKVQHVIKDEYTALCGRKVSGWHSAEWYVWRNAFIRKRCKKCLVLVLEHKREEDAAQQPYSSSRQR